MLRYTQYYDYAYKVVFLKKGCLGTIIPELLCQNHVEYSSQAEILRDNIESIGQSSAAKMNKQYRH